MCERDGRMNHFNDLSKLAAKLSLDGKTSKSEKKDRMIMALNAYVLNDVSERANNILDNTMLESIGIKGRDLDWREKERVFVSLVVNDPSILIGVPVDGDPFKTLSDQETIDRFIDWERHLNVRAVMPNEYVETFFDSLKNVKIDIASLNDLKREHERELREQEKKRSLGKNFRRRK